MSCNCLRKNVALLLMVILGLLVGCRVSPEVSPLEPVISPVSSPDALSLSPGVSPLPTTETFTVPTPDVDTAVVWGRLVDQQTGLAPLESTVALGSLTEMDSGIPVVSLHHSDDPSVVPSVDGWFAITDITPGEYGLVLLSPDISFLLDNGEGESMLVTLEAGDVVDLGQITVTLP